MKPQPCFPASDCQLAGAVSINVKWCSACRLAVSGLSSRPRAFRWRRGASPPEIDTARSSPVLSALSSDLATRSAIASMAFSTEISGTDDDRERGVQCKRRTEYRDATQDGLLGRRQQIVAPVQRRTQRLVPRQCKPAPLRQDGEHVVQPAGQRGNAEEFHAGCGKFDGERNAIQAPADFGDGRRRRIIE